MMVMTMMMIMVMMMVKFTSNIPYEGDEWVTERSPGSVDKFTFFLNFYSQIISKTHLLRYH